MEDKRSREAVGIQWHPAFYGAAELELRDNKEDIEFQREYNLSKEPLRMDLLVVRKLADVQVKNEIGHIFKKYNIIEYKSPGASLSIDTFYKTVGYACLYKGLGKTVDAVPVEELSISIFREAYPAELFKKLESLGMGIQNRYPGIYYIRQWRAMPDIQIVVTGAVDPEKHPALRVLSQNVKEEDVRTFVGEISRLTGPGDRDNADAVIQASIAANRESYERIRREDPFMCEALRELMKDEIESEIVERERKARQETRQEIRQETIRNLMDSMKWTADQAMAAMKIPEEDRKEYMARL